MAQSKKKSGRPVSLTQVLVVVILAIVVYFAVDLTQAAFTIYRLRGWEESLDKEVAELQTEVGQLQKQKEQMHTDAYLERKAREELRLVRPGDVLVVPVTDKAQPTPAPQITPSPGPSLPPVEKEKPFWQAWWDRFFH